LSYDQFVFEVGVPLGSSPASVVVKIIAAINARVVLYAPEPPDMAGMFNPIPDTRVSTRAMSPFPAVPSMSNSTFSFVASSALVSNVRNGSTTELKAFAETKNAQYMVIFGNPNEMKLNLIPGAVLALIAAMIFTTTESGVEPSGTPTSNTN
jgi:hypothetical protein